MKKAEESSRSSQDSEEVFKFNFLTVLQPKLFVVLHFLLDLFCVFLQSAGFKIKTLDWISWISRSLQTFGYSAPFWSDLTTYRLYNTVSQNIRTRPL